MRQITLKRCARIAQTFSEFYCDALLTSYFFESLANNIPEYISNRTKNNFTQNTEITNKNKCIY